MLWHSGSEPHGQNRIYANLLLDDSDKLSDYEGMELSKEIEVLAITLGASCEAVAKWHKRGIPARWQLKLLDARGEVREPRSANYLSSSLHSATNEAAE